MTTARTEDLVELTTAPTEAQAGIIRAVLEDAGIESWTRKASGFDYFGLGTLGFAFTAVTVRASDLERAQAALDANRQDSVDIDWSEVDVGEAEDEAAQNVATEERSTSPAGRRFRLPWKAVGVWIVLIFLGMVMADPIVGPLIMVPIAVIDVIRRGHVGE